MRILNGWVFFSVSKKMKNSLGYLVAIDSIVLRAEPIGTGLPPWTPSDWPPLVGDIRTRIISLM